MENKFIVDECQIFKCYEDEQKDAIWRINSLKNTSSEFEIHVSHNGLMYITYFPGCDITFKKQAKLIYTLCRKLQQEGMYLQIRIKDTNTYLKNLCISAGFKYLKREYGKAKRFNIFYFPN